MQVRSESLQFAKSRICAVALHLELERTLGPVLHLEKLDGLLAEPDQLGKALEPGVGGDRCRNCALELGEGAVERVRLLLGLPGCARNLLRFLGGAGGFLADVGGLFRDLVRAGCGFGEAFVYFPVRRFASPAESSLETVKGRG